MFYTTFKARVEPMETDNMSLDHCYRASCKLLVEALRTQIVALKALLDDMTASRDAWAAECNRQLQDSVTTVVSEDGNQIAAALKKEYLRGYHEAVMEG